MKAIDVGTADEVTPPQGSSGRIECGVTELGDAPGSGAGSSAGAVGSYPAGFATKESLAPGLRITYARRHG